MKTAPFGVSELPWGRNCLNCNRIYSFEIHVSGRPWARNGSERIQNGSKTNPLEHLDGLGSKIERNGTETAHLEQLGGLGPKIVQNGTEPKHLGFKRHPPKGSGFKRPPPVRAVKLALSDTLRARRAPRILKNDFTRRTSAPHVRG